MFRCISLLLLGIVSCSSLASIFTNMVNHPTQSNLVYSMSEGKFATLGVDQEGWQTHDIFHIEHQHYGNQVAIYPDGSGALITVGHHVYRVPFNASGHSYGVFESLLDLESFFNYEVKIAPEQNLILIITEDSLIQYEVTGSSANEVKRYTAADFTLPSSYNSFMHPDGAIIDFDGRIYLWNGTGYDAPIEATYLLDTYPEDKLVLDSNGGLVLKENGSCNLVSMGWPIEENRLSKSILDDSCQYRSLNGSGSHSERVRLQENGFSHWLPSPSKIDQKGDEADLPSWYKAYAREESAFEHRPVLLDDALWFGPVKITANGSNYEFELFNFLSLSNTQLPFSELGSPAWANEHNKLSTESPFGLVLHTLDEQGSITDKTVYSFTSKGRWAHLLKAEPTERGMFALVTNPDEEWLYAQIYNETGELVSEAPVFDSMYYDGGDVFGGDSRPVISPDGSNVYFEIRHKIFHCSISQSQLLSNCANVDVEELTFPRISPYRDGIVYWGTHRTAFIEISHNGTELVVADTWSLANNDECCVEQVFYNRSTDRLFFSNSDWQSFELKQDGSVVEFEQYVRRPMFYDSVSGLAIAEGGYIGNAFGFIPETDRYVRLDFRAWDRPDVNEYAFKALIGPDLLVFHDLESVDGIKVVKAPLKVNLAVDLGDPAEINQYQELELDLSNLFTETTADNEVWLSAHGYSTADHKHAAPEGDKIRFMVTKDYALAQSGSHPFTLTVEQGVWQVEFALPTWLININEAPVFSAVETQEMAIGAEYGGELRDIVNDPDGDTLTFTVTGLPPGLRTEGSYLTGIPSQEGQYTVTVIATDPAGLSDTVEFVINVTVGTPEDLGIDLSAGGGGGSLPITLLVLLTSIGLRRCKRY